MLCCRFFNKSSFRLLAPAKSPFRVPTTHLLLFLSYIISSFCRLFQTSVTPSTFQQYHTLGSEQRRRHDENVCFSHLLFTGVVSSFLYWFFFFFYVRVQTKIKPSTASEFECDFSNDRWTSSFHIRLSSSPYFTLFFPILFLTFFFLYLSSYCIII